MIRFVLAIILFLSLSAHAWASKEGQVKQGNSLYHKGDYDNSLKHYEEALKKDGESPAINFNVGTAQYKSGKYSDAVSSLQKGLLSSDPLLKKNAHFNLGNVFYGLGKQSEKQNTDHAIEAMEESLRQFEAAMNLDDKDQDARYNYDIVKKELEQLKKKKEQEKNNQQQKQDKDQKQDQDQSQSSSGQNSDKQDQQKNQDNQSSASNDNQKQSESSQENKDENKDDTQNASAPQPGEMTKEEAKALLKQFKQDEEPAGLLNLQKSGEEERPVLKDW